MSRRVVAAAGALALLGLAACGSNAEPAAEAPPSSPVEQTTAPSVDTEEATTEEPSPEAEPAGLFEKVTIPNLYAVSTGEDYFTNTFKRDETVTIQTFSESGELVAELPQDASVCTDVIALGNLEDGRIIAGYHFSTPGEGLTPASETYGVRAFDPVTSEVVWDVELPDERTDEPSVLFDECAGIDKGSVSGLGTWVGVEGGRAINVADGTLTDQLDEGAEDVLWFFGDLTGSRDGGDFRVIDPATGDVVFTIDGRLADQRGAGVTVDDLYIRAVVSFRGNHIDGVSALSMSDGQEVWRWAAPELKDFSMYTGTANEGFVLVRVQGADVGTVAVDVETGEERWSLPPLDISYCGGVDGNAVVIANGSLVVIDGETGEEIASSDEITDCFGMVGDHVLVSGGVARVAPLN